MLLESRDRAPRHPRKPWRHLYLDVERKRAADVAYRHELLVLRVTMNPRPGKADEDAEFSDEMDDDGGQAAKKAAASRKATPNLDLDWY